MAKGILGLVCSKVLYSDNEHMGMVDAEGAVAASFGYSVKLLKETLIGAILATVRILIYLGVSFILFASVDAFEPAS